MPKLTVATKKLLGKNTEEALKNQEIIISSLWRTQGQKRNHIWSLERVKIQVAAKVKIVRTNMRIGV